MKQGDWHLQQDRFCNKLRGNSVKLCNIQLKADRGLVERMLEAMSEDNEFSAFISPVAQKRALILSIFSAYYHRQADKEIIFDTNRLWCSKLPLIRELFPEAKVI
jgi:hypothetical protein